MNNTATNDLGLIYMNARYYVGAIGRFASADILVPAPTNPQSLNRYTYSLNNPVKYQDPTGHCPTPEADSGSIICVAFFIPTAWALHLKGDNRDFSSDSDPSQSRAYIYINTNDGSFSYVVNPSSAIWGGPYAPRTDNYVNVAVDESTGELVLTYDLLHSEPLSDGISPAINGEIRFRPDGNGGFESSGNRDAFPNAEAYYYEGGELVNVIFQKEARISEWEYEKNWTFGGPLNLIFFTSNQFWGYPSDETHVFNALNIYQGPYNLAGGFPHSQTILFD
jgi:RHS repeat-associated protein